MFTINPNTNRIAPLDVKRVNNRTLLVCGLSVVLNKRINPRKKTP